MTFSGQASDRLAALGAGWACPSGYAHEGIPASVFRAITHAPAWDFLRSLGAEMIVPRLAQLAPIRRGGHSSAPRGLNRPLVSRRCGNEGPSGRSAAVKAPEAKAHIVTAEAEGIVQG